MYDVKEIEKIYRGLHCPPKFWRPKMQKLLANDYYMCISLRQDNGKTTNALLYGLIFYKVHGFTMCYCRTDTDMIRRSEMSKLFNTVVGFHYIEMIFPDFNDVYYDSMTHDFYLCFRNQDTGEIEKTDIKAFCHAISIENHTKYKSSFNDINCMYFLYDEFLDTRRQTATQMVELANTISSIGRLRPDFHVLMLSNNISQYSFWWEEFCIKEDIELIGYGNSFEKKTELGTTLYCELVELTEERKTMLKDKLVRFYGFNTPKMAQFTGTATWQGYNYPHLEIESEIQTLIGFIKHRGKYVAMYMVSDNIHKQILYFTMFNTPQSQDLPVFTIYPYEQNETIASNMYPLCVTCLKERRIAFSNNNVGTLVDDFFKESNIRVKLY